MKRGLALAVATFVLDQLSKAAVLRYVADDITVTRHFNLILVYNRGVSFSLLTSDGRYAQAWLVALASVIVAGLLVWMRKEKEPLARRGLGLIVGGAVGNIADRLRIGAVVDFLDFHVGEWHWAAFNLADSAICLGAGLILLAGFIEYKGKKRHA